MILNLNIKLASVHREAAAKDFKMTESFHDVKQMIDQKIIMSFPDFDKQYILSTDASYKGAGAVSTQKHSDDQEKIIYLFSKSFNDIKMANSQT